MARLVDFANGSGFTHLDTNVLIGFRYGQLSTISEQDLLDHYLSPLTQLEMDYPGITFVCMTGNADGSGETDNLYIRNQQNPPVYY